MLILFRSITLTILSGMIFLSQANATGEKLSPDISKGSLHIIKRMEYKEGVPNGLLHAISLVETNIGRTGKYLPWPYTIRLNRYKSEKLINLDKAYNILERLLDVGYSKFDLAIDGDSYYSLSSSNLEDLLQNASSLNNAVITSRSVIKYMSGKEEAKAFLKLLLNSKWYNFKVGIMQLSYSQIRHLPDIYKSLDAYNNISIMIKQLKEIRKSYEWWESVGTYHSKRPKKAKRYVKNVWSMYQRVYKLKVK
ncbi:MAG: lytic transglycosylase domain-containing protein [Proteobacteria bacterium]|nr:lytic transglycosylase domain-containing protein [Pseudomonadota bacterium]